MSLLLAAGLAAIGGSARAESILDEFAQVRDIGKRSHVLDVENDSLLLNRDDGLYTSGLRYSYLYSLNDGQSLKVFGWRIGQELYTASDIKLEPSEIGRNDRPYAGWLYVGAFRERHRADGGYYRLGLDIGCMGPCSGGSQTQDFLHGLLGQPRPQAWSTQLGNEWGAVLYGDFAPERWSWGENVDIRPSVHGRFGNIFTDVSGDLTLRVGRLNRFPGQDTFHGFVRLGARVVGYNATLQGGYFSDENARTVEPKDLVPELEAGLAWNRAPYNFLVTVVRRGNEIDNLPGSVGIQNFVRVGLSYTP